jgi:hypothetical protein
MPDMQTISAVLSSITVASKFIKGSIEKIKDNAVRKKVEELLNAIIPLQSHIITLQSMNSASIQKIDGLETKLREIEDWAKEEASHELDEIVPGVNLYIKKPTGEHSGPPVHFCPNCFNIHHKKSIIQLFRQGSAGKDYHCPNTPVCQFKFRIPSHNRPPRPGSMNPKAWT